LEEDYSDGDGDLKTSNCVMKIEC